jgi:hypothetical protein
VDGRADAIMKPKRQERLTDTARIKLTTVSNIPLRDRDKQTTHEGHKIPMSTDEELLQGLRDLMAEDERELGPIPDEAKAEVERQWRD